MAGLGTTGLAATSTWRAVAFFGKSWSGLFGVDHGRPEAVVAAVAAATVATSSLAAALTAAAVTAAIAAAIAAALTAAAIATAGAPW